MTTNLQLRNVVTRAAEAHARHEVSCCNCEATAVTDCAKCELSFCKSCLEEAHKLKALRVHASMYHEAGHIAAEQARRRKTRCPLHPEQQLDLFCFVDNVPVGDRWDGRARLTVSAAAGVSTMRIVWPTQAT